MAYSEKVIDHYENPRNVGKLDDSAKNVGTGMVGAPACGDVMKLQIKVDDDGNAGGCAELETSGTPFPRRAPRRAVRGRARTFPSQLMRPQVVDAKFKTFGCGSAIASSSVASEWVKGKNIDTGSAVITNKDIAAHLNLPPVKLHCSMLAEDAINAAIADYRAKQEKAKGAEAQAA